MNKLNLGCGYVQPDDLVNVDILDYGHNIVANVLEGLPFEDEHFDFIIMNHTLQMFKYDELPIVLKEVRRVMEEGATLRILVPDLDKAVKAWQQGDIEYFPISDNIGIGIDAKFHRYIYWHGDTRCGFNEMSLRELLLNNNLIVRDELGIYGECELDSRKEESLIIEAIK